MSYDQQKNACMQISLQNTTQTKLALVTKQLPSTDKRVAAFAAFLQATQNRSTATSGAQPCLKNWGVHPPSLLSSPSSPFALMGAPMKAS